MSVQYEEKIFCFVDIMGFRDLIEESKDNPQRIVQIYKLLERAREMATLPRTHKFRYLNIDITRCHSHAFSDTVTMSSPFDSFDYLNFMIAWAMSFQRLMWYEERVFVRGGISLGDVYDQKNDGIVFGPGMIRAYDLEEKIAVWLRIVIDPTILRRLSRDDLDRAFREWLVQDDADPDVHYLDYLTDQFALIASGENKQSRLDCMKLFEDHKKSVALEIEHIREQTKQISRTAEKEKAILDKYCSLSKYHNSVIERLSRSTLDLINNQDLISDVVMHTMDDAVRSAHGMDSAEFETKYTAEKIEFIDIMLLTGIAVDRIYSQYETQLEKMGHSELEAFFSLQIPKALSEMVDSLDKSRIDITSLIYPTDSSPL